MKAATPKPRNARAPRTKAKAAAPEKTAPLFQTGTPDGCLTEEQRMDLVKVLSEPPPVHPLDCECGQCMRDALAMRPPACDVFTEPVHKTWSTMVALLLASEAVELSPQRRKAWEWFRSMTADPKVTMTNRSVGVVWVGRILFEQGDLLKSVPKGGRK